MAWQTVDGSFRCNQQFLNRNANFRKRRAEEQKKLNPACLLCDAGRAIISCSSFQTSREAVCFFSVLCTYSIGEKNKIDDDQ